jgi:hypothetical protein
MAKVSKSVKAYNNTEFLASSNGREIRLLAEYLEPQARFRKHKIMDTIVFFGSARLKAKRDAQTEFNKIKNANPKKVPNFAKELRKAQHHLEMSRYYEDAVE